MTDRQAKRDAARKAIKEWWDKPEHKAEKGSERDKETIDDPREVEENEE